MQQILLPTATHAALSRATKDILNRSPLYDADTNKLYIKYDDVLNQVSASVDEKNIVFNDEGDISLNDNVQVNTATVFSDDQTLAYRSNVVFGHVTPDKNIIPLIKISNMENGVISGMLYEKGTFDASYHFSVSSSGKHYFRGASSSFDTKARLVLLYKTDSKDPTNPNITEAYLGVKFFGSVDSTIYFSGFDNRKPSLIPPLDLGSDMESISEDTVMDEEEVVKGKSVIYEWQSKFWDPFKYNWNFDKKPSWLIKGTTIDASVENPDFGDGLSANIDWFLEGTSNIMTLNYNASLLGDKGQLTIPNTGRALKLVLKRDRSDVSVKFTSTTSKATMIGLFDQYELKDSYSCPNNKEATTATFAKLQAGTYYIGIASGSATKILNITLDNPGYDGKEMTFIPGHDSLDYTWDFTSKPSFIPADGDLGYGLYIITNGVRWSYNNDGYAICGIPKIHQDENLITDVMFLNVPYDNTSIDIDLALSEKNLGEFFASADKVSATILQETFSERKNIATLNLTRLGWLGGGSRSGTLKGYNLPRGRYYVTFDSNLKVDRIRLRYPAAQGSNQMVQTPDTSVAAAIRDIIKTLPETKENGIPNIIKINGAKLGAAELEQIAALFKNSDKLIGLDLSECSVLNDATQWAQTFENCTSLSSISLPQGVEALIIKNFASPFLGCMFLSKIIFPDSVTKLESNDNQSLFIGTRIRTVVLPKNLNKLGAYAFKDSGVRNVIFPPDFTLANPFDIFAWACFFRTLPNFKLYMTAEQYKQHDWDNATEYGNFFNDTNQKTIAAKVAIYTDLNKLLEDLNY